MPIRTAIAADLPWFLRQYSGLPVVREAWWDIPFEFIEMVALFREGWIHEMSGAPVGFGLVDSDARGPLLVHAYAYSDRVADLAAADLAEEGGDWRAYIVGSWYLCGLFVDPAHRRQGIGRGLSLARVAAATDAEATGVFVACIDGTGTSTLFEGNRSAPLFSCRLLTA